MVKDRFKIGVTFFLEGLFKVLVIEVEDKEELVVILIRIEVVYDRVKVRFYVI